MVMQTTDNGVSMEI